MVRQGINKTKLAKELGVSRGSLYYRRKREGIDLEVKTQIEGVMVDHPDYGHKRIALHLKLNKKRILRVMKMYGLKPYRRRRRLIKKNDRGIKVEYVNLLVGLEIVRFGQVWCTDFTYIKYQGKFIYLATIIDLFNREVVGFNISRFHNRWLVIGALEDALGQHEPPEIVHSDQGSEYVSEDFTQLVGMAGGKVSMSEKASPWQNGHQESFFGHFKQEAGDLNRFEELGELIEYIYQQIYYYNHKRIHSALKMPPVGYRKRHAV